jgi:hypothetical protein
MPSYNTWLSVHHPEKYAEQRRLESDSWLKWDLVSKNLYPLKYIKADITDRLSTRQKTALFKWLAKELGYEITD